MLSFFDFKEYTRYKIVQEYVTLSCVTFQRITPSTHVEKAMWENSHNSPYTNNLVVASMMMCNNEC